MFRGPTLPLFRVGGFQIGAHWSLFAAMGLMAVRHGGIAGIGLSVLIFGSVLAHELGHSWVARRLRVPIDGIDLHFLGGVAKMQAPPRSPRDEIWIALAGPVVSLALGALSFAASSWLGASSPSWLSWVGGVNVVLGLFNLLPALPMDGGRVLRAVLARRRGLSAGTRTAVFWNRGFALLLGGTGLLIDPWLLLLAFVIWRMGSLELQQIRRHEMLRARGFADAWDPWARYQRSVERAQRKHHQNANPAPRAAAPRVPEEILEPGEAAGPPLGRPWQPAAGAGSPRAQFVRDPQGRWVVVQM